MLLCGSEPCTRLFSIREHPQGVRRSCKGLAPQQHTQHGSLLKNSRFITDELYLNSTSANRTRKIFTYRAALHAHFQRITGEQLAA